LPEARKVLYGRSAAPHPYAEVPKGRHAGVAFTVALKQRNLDQLHRVLMEVSDPRHVNYGKHWTHAQILELVQPVEADRKLVLDWLKAEAGVIVEDRGDALRVRSSIAAAERLFNTKLSTFINLENEDTVPFVKFMGKFSIPASLEHVISMVTGITEFPTNIITPKIVTADGTDACNVPYTIKKIYNMSYVEVFNSRASQGPFSVDSHQTKTIGYGETDLTSWEKLNDLPTTDVYQVIGDAADLYGPKDSSLAGGEALLDIQMLLAFAPNANTSFWIIADWIYEYANEILTTPGAPLVNSMSYGWEETNQCDITDCNALGFPDSETYIQRTDAEFLKCGVAGFTVLAASGDNGVEPNRKCTIVYQVYPASSLYVTTVGATAIVKSSESTPLGADAPPICSDKNCACSTSQEEHGAMHNNSALFDTGGGFSHYNPRPTWQDAAVEAYYNSGVAFPSTQYWNNTNRGYPDVAAAGGNIAVYQNGKVTQVAGTSASCPIWAGILSTLNQDRFKKNEPPLGFVNPLLYQMWGDNPKTFNDITVGSNGGNHFVGGGACDNFAFHATEGWDAVSGLGTPNFGLIREYINSM
jgi:tripeptidyl-peptidase-1